MTLPIAELTGSFSAIGMVVAVMLGFGFGFVLERAGFGRANKLAAQFYLYDMTVFKVMFGAIVTAMLGLVFADGVGIVSLAALSEGAASTTYVWPMLFGGLLLGAGFIISGYCPGTSLVAMASGSLDAVATVAGVLVGSLVFAESFPLIQSFYTSGDHGQLYLYEWLGLSPALLAAIFAIVAVLAFLGAEKVERIMTKRISVAEDVVDEEVRAAPAPKRFAFGLYGAVALAAIVTLLYPVDRTARANAIRGVPIGSSELAKRVIDEPWSMRIIDLRAAEQCSAARVPGSECVQAAGLAELGLAHAAGKRDLVLVSAEGLEAVPAEVTAYTGKVLLLEGGFDAWKEYALETPTPPGAGANADEREAYAFRASVHAALAGRKAPPPAARPATKGYVPKKKKGGGCG